ncbi:hypothetical protein Htur_3832 (plasmid) [Haloterrigena turkmenica DSM 5511]|uniref:Uncharacterized protein n=1 Tax=Haloterrigena turkmenica (strain ATCC 51198 / DSM 5511 / JCM 9101 / NCIMB 13204 / VKM B-1734 / 4k) TaxID=543526 RepID=D2RZZ5_HALTV|nr:hypothetical protein Htur_3832 [Haloterrigena turkmenica DSM 5511]
MDLDIIGMNYVTGFEVQRLVLETLIDKQQYR